MCGRNSSGQAEPEVSPINSRESHYENAPAKFRCSFLIHLEPVDSSHTTVEIFEYQPYVWAGEYFGFSAHAILPTTLHDIRPVEPTASDRQAILALIVEPPTLPNRAVAN